MTDGGASDGEQPSGDPSTGSGRRRLLTLLQWGLAAAAFWYVARDVDWAATASELAGVPVAVVLAIGVVTAAEFGTRFSMWYALLAGRGVSFGTAARIDLVVKFVNHLVPSKASGHSIAPLVVRHYADTEWSDAVSVAALNTGLYAALYGLVALAGLAVFAGRLPRGWLLVVGLSTGAYLLAGALVLLAGRRLELAGALVGRLEATVRRVPRIGDRLSSIAGAVPSLTADSAASFRALSSRPAVVIPYALAWAGTLMVAPGLRVWLLLTGLGEGFAPAVALPVLLVVAYSVTVLPLTPGGVGIAEASATAVFVAVGVRPELAAAIVLVDRTLGVYLPAAIGWVPAARLDLPSLLSTGS